MVATGMKALEVRAEVIEVVLNYLSGPAGVSAYGRRANSGDRISCNRASQPIGRTTNNDTFVYASAVNVDRGNSVNGLNQYLH